MDKIIGYLTKDKHQLATWGLFLLLSTYVLSLDQSSLLLSMLNQISRFQMDKMLCIGILTSIASILSLLIIWWKRKPNLNYYEHIEDPGWYVHKKTNKRFCGKCIHPPKNLESPLSVYKGTKDWHCIICEEKYVPKDGGNSLFLDDEQKQTDKLNSDPKS